MVDEAGRELLLIPGPVTVSRAVRDALARPVRAHYGADWAALYEGLNAKLATIFDTRGTVLQMFGPGSAALELVLRSGLAPGDHVLVPGGNRFFGRRLADIARAGGLVVHELPSRSRRPVDVEEARRALAAEPRLRALAVVHHETDQGVLNPVQELAGLARERDLLMLVDAVSSLGGVEFHMDDWGVDACVSVANKCLAGPIGVAPVAIGGRLWQALDDGRPKSAGWYLNLATWREWMQSSAGFHPHPTTMPTSVVEAFDTAVDQVLSEGLPAFQSRHARVAGRVRDGLRELGFEILADDAWASPLATAVLGVPGMDVTGYMTWMRETRGLRLGGGLDEFAGRAFRVGHMGAAARDDVVGAFLDATASYVEEHVRR